MGQTATAGRTVTEHRRTAEAVDANVGRRETEADRLRRDIAGCTWDELMEVIGVTPLADSGYGEEYIEAAIVEAARRLDQHTGQAA